MSPEIPRIHRSIAEQYPQLGGILAAAKSTALEKLLAGKQVVNVEHVKAADRMAQKGTANYHYCKIELPDGELIFVLVRPQEVRIAHFDGNEALDFISADGSVQRARGDAQSLKELEQALLRAIPTDRVA